MQYLGNAALSEPELSAVIDYVFATYGRGLR
jgi:hypothetical protein